MSQVITATKMQDGSIAVLVSIAEGAIMGDGGSVFAPTDPDYQTVLSAIGDIRVGESVVIDAWPV